MKNCKWEIISIQYCITKTNAKLGSVWLRGHWVCDGSVMVGILGGGWLGEWAGGWSGRSHIHVHCACINSAQCIPV